MPNLEFHEKQLFEKLFNREGYVITKELTNSRFSDFFKDYEIDIDNRKYFYKTGSKMNRLRVFWKIEPNKTVGKVLEALLKYADEIESIDEKDKKKS